jgi:hypothetical protein
MRRIRNLARRPVVWVVLAAVVAVTAVGLELFQPWKLWVDQTVNEPAPPAVTALTAPTRSAGPVGPVGPTGPVGPVVLAQGTLVSHEHATTGAVRIVLAADGIRYLRLDDLDTSNGPQLEVWLTDATVLTGTAGWYVFDDGRHVSLGPLKGNKGNQNYPIPADLDLAGYRSVSIWCARFHVSFGAAELGSP